MLERLFALFHHSKNISCAALPCLEVLAILNLSTNEKEEILKTLPSLSFCERKQTCRKSVNDECIFCDHLNIAWPDKSCGPGNIFGFWNINNKIRSFYSRITIDTIDLSHL